MTLRSILRSRGIAVLAVCLAGPALSQSEIRLGDPGSNPTFGEPITVEPGAQPRAAQGFEDGIEAESLAPPTAGSAGLTSAAAVGLSRDMWNGTDAATVRALLRDAQPSGIRAVDTLIRKALIAGVEPPEGAEGLLELRVEALARFGATEDAASLAGTAARITKAGADAYLAVGRERELCNRPRLTDQTPELGPDAGYWAKLRGFCLASQDDPLASVAISAMQELGTIEGNDALLLEAMVDEALVEFVEMPSSADLTPLRVAILRALGKPPTAATAASAPLPIAAGLFALESTGAEGALTIGERLEQVGAIDNDTLADLYRLYATEGGNTPALRRATAAAAAISDPSVKTLAEALFSAARQDGIVLFSTLARTLAATAVTLPPSAAAGSGGEGYAVRDAMLLGGYAREAGVWADALGQKSPADEADAAGLSAIADPAWPGVWRSTLGDALRGRAGTGDENARRVLAALAGLDIAPRPQLVPEGYFAAAVEGRMGEAIFGMAAAIRQSSPAGARDIDKMIRALSAVGLQDYARQIAIEAILIARWT